MKILLGHTEGNAKVYLNDKDLQTHIHGIGASRTGKSKLVEHIIRQLLYERRGACVIDPHGSLYNDLVQYVAYLRPKANIVFFDPSSSDRIVGFNPFRRGPGDVSAQADRRVKATIKAWGAVNADQTPRLERLLRSFYTVLLELGYPIEVARYFISFEHKDVRERLVEHIKSESARIEFSHLSALKNPKDFIDQVESVRNRLTRFLEPQQLRRVMGLDENAIDLKQIVERGDILLVNLQPSDVLTEENARLLGTLLLNELWEIGMRRKPAKTGGKPSDFFIVVDEFQKFLTPDISAMLDQGAKYGYHLVLLHQHLSQLKQIDEWAYGSVMTNARVKCVFGGLSREDAKTLSQEIFPGQIDLKRHKFVITQTKFRPVYSRETVYNKGSSYSKTEGRGSTSGTTTSSGHSSGDGYSYTDSYQDRTYSHQTGDSTASGDSYGTSESESETHSYNEGEADVPFYRQEEFQEVSSITAYPLDEQLWMLSDDIMNQGQRAFMLRRPGQDTVTVIAPYVEPYGVTPERLTRYLEEKLQNHLTGEEADKRLEDFNRNLLANIRPPGKEFKPGDEWENP